MHTPADDDEHIKAENTVWWIASIAISVVCCSVLFILFASYLVDIKEDIKDTNMRTNAIEEREDRILADVELMNRRASQGGTQQQTVVIPSIAVPSTDNPRPSPSSDVQPSILPMEPIVPGGNVSTQPSPALVTEPAPEQAPPSPAVSIPTLPAAPEKP